MLMGNQVWCFRVKVNKFPISDKGSLWGADWGGRVPVILGLAGLSILLSGCGGSFVVVVILALSN